MGERGNDWNVNISLTEYFLVLLYFTWMNEQHQSLLRYGTSSTVLWCPGSICFWAWWFWFWCCRVFCLMEFRLWKVDLYTWFSVFHNDTNMILLNDTFTTFQHCIFFSEPLVILFFVQITFSHLLFHSVSVFHYLCTYLNVLEANVRNGFIFTI